MTLDPVRWCVHCQRPRARDGFSFLPGLKVKREVCAVCREIIMAAREARKAKA